jgi:hypothetical protein
LLKKLGLPILALAVVAGGAYYFFGRQQPMPIEFGVPIYPGADSGPKDSFAARLSPRARERLVKAVILTTSDPPEKVIEFYRQKLGGTARILQMSKRGVAAAVFQTEVQGQPRVITVRANEDTSKTEITIGSVAPQ